MKQNPTIKIRRPVKNVLELMQQRSDEDLTFNELIRRLLLSLVQDDTRNKMRRLMVEGDLTFLTKTRIIQMGGE